MLFNRYALTEARERQGLTKAEFSRRVKETQAYVTYVEKGERQPSRDVIERWSKVLEIKDPRALYIEDSDVSQRDLLRLTSARLAEQGAA